MSSYGAPSPASSYNTPSRLEMMDSPLMTPGNAFTPQTPGGGK